MKFMFLFIVFVLLSQQVFAGGDRIGNGGTIWICRENGKIQKGILLDRLESQISFLPPLTTPDSGRGYPLRLVYEREDFIRKNLPELYRQWRPYIINTLISIKFVTKKIATSYDAHPLFMPIARDCKAGWQLEQFANYINIGNLSINQEIWNSENITDFDRAALIWHEVIYHWLRDKFQDYNSKRARLITMTVFSRLNPEEMQRNLDQILFPDKP